MITFVLVPGACHGGWWYEPLARRLEQDGHAAVPVTLAGLEDEPRIDRLITLYGVDPLPFFSERARPHPVATFLQALPLTGAWHQVATKHYVAAQWPDETPMALSTQRAEADPSFKVHHWDIRHNVLADGPDRVLDLLRTMPHY